MNRRAKRAGGILRFAPSHKGKILKEVDPAREARRGDFCGVHLLAKAESLRELTQRAKRAGEILRFAPSRKGKFLKEVDPAREARRGILRFAPSRKGKILKGIDPAREARRGNFAIRTLSQR